MIPGIWGITKRLAGNVSTVQDGYAGRDWDVITTKHTKYAKRCSLATRSSFFAPFACFVVPLQRLRGYAGD
jgi:hypothetical protein